MIETIGGFLLMVALPKNVLLAIVATALVATHRRIIRIKQRRQGDEITGG